MLTKTLRFDNDVLEQIRNMDWRENGRLGAITAKLDRDLYIRVNKALEAMGGKWSRKAGGHVFTTDPRLAVEGLVNSGVLQVEKDGFFETPRAVVKRMLELAPVCDAFILEPSAGMGAIATILREAGAQEITCIEKNEQRAAHLKSLGFTTYCLDFMEFNPVEANDINEPYWRIYMNPPFENGQDISHVCRAYNLLIPGGQMAAVMSEGPFFRNDAKSVAFRQWLEEVGGYSEPLDRGSFKASGTMVNTRLVVIQKPLSC